MADIRVLVIAGDPLARAGLATLLSTQRGIFVAAQAADDADMQQMADVYQPDIALWDLGVNSAATLERFARWLQSGKPSVALLANPADAARAWAAGARGLVMRNAGAGEIAAAIDAVSRGLVATSGEIAVTLFPSSSILPYPEFEALTPREEQVLKLMAKAYPNKEIARRLGISEHTVKFHVNAILSKLHAQSRTEAVVVATRAGLVMI